MSYAKGVCLSLVFGALVAAGARADGEVFGPPPPEKLSTWKKAVILFSDVAGVVQTLREVEGSPQNADDLEKINKAGEAQADLVEHLKEFGVFHAVKEWWQGEAAPKPPEPAASASQLDPILKDLLEGTKPKDQNPDVSDPDTSMEGPKQDQPDAREPDWLPPPPPAVAPIDPPPEDPTAMNPVDPAPEAPSITNPDDSNNDDANIAPEFPTPDVPGWVPPEEPGADDLSLTQPDDMNPGSSDYAQPDDMNPGDSDYVGTDDGVNSDDPGVAAADDSNDDASDLDAVREAIREALQGGGSGDHGD